MKTIYLILLALLMVATVSCEKKDENNGPPIPGEESGCSDHVLKRPYLVYNGDQTGFSVIIQTTSYVHQMGGKVYITFGHDGNFGSDHGYNANKRY